MALFSHVSTAVRSGLDAGTVSRLTAMDQETPGRE